MILPRLFPSSTPYWRGVCMSGVTLAGLWGWAACLCVCFSPPAHPYFHPRSLVYRSAPLASHFPSIFPSLCIPWVGEDLIWPGSEELLLKGLVSAPSPALPPPHPHTHLSCAVAPSLEKLLDTHSAGEGHCPYPGPGPQPRGEAGRPCLPYHQGAPHPHSGPPPSPRETENYSENLN